MLTRAYWAAPAVLLAAVLTTACSPAATEGQILTVCGQRIGQAEQAFKPGAFVDFRHADKATEYPTSRAADKAWIYDSSCRGIAVTSEPQRLSVASSVPAAAQGMFSAVLVSIPHGGTVLTIRDSSGLEKTITYLPS